MMMRVSQVIDAIYILLLLATFAWLATCVMPSKTSVAEVYIPDPILNEIPEEYVDNMEGLLKDYQAERITARKVIQIMLLWHTENEGTFLPLYDTDTYADKYYIHTKTHNELQREKQQRHDQKGKR